MADKTEIAWCDSTFNPWIGCTKIGPGCDNCYAEADFDHRKHRVKWGAGQERSRTSAANWKKPLQWNRADFRECGDCGWRGEIDTLVDDTCPSCGRHQRLEPARRRVFCASLADVFDNEVPVEWRRNLFELIKNTPNLDWLLLTKRIGNAARMIEEAISELDIGYDPDYAMWPWPNVWLGATVVNQEEADRDIPKLLATPAALRWVSAEPLLGPVAIREYLEWRNTVAGTNTVTNERSLSWVIVGGESGPNARPMHPGWARSLRDQCAAAGVPFLFKQWGEFVTGHQSEHGLNYCYDNARTGGWVEPNGAYSVGEKAAPVSPMNSEHVFKLGKKAAGRLLDGVQHDGYPCL